MKFFALLLALWGCQQEKIETFSGTAMTIPYQIQIGKSLSRQERTIVQSAIDLTFSDVDAIYNNWNPNSELSKLNRLPKGVKHPLSKELRLLLKQTDQIVTLSNGRFDPTVEPLQHLWKEHLTRGERPTKEQIDALESAIGWKNIHFDDHYFWKDHDKTMIDLGGIAKGLAVDLLVDRLKEYSNSLFVEWGGEIKTFGLHPDDRPWKIFISQFGDPNPESSIAILELDNEAIATSGDYHQSWQQKGIKFTHIFNPETKMPIEVHSDSIASASVIAPSCALADALATCCFLFKTEEEISHFSNQAKESFDGVRFVIAKRRK